AAALLPRYGPVEPPRSSRDVPLVQGPAARLRAGRSAATSPLPSVAGRRHAASFPLLPPRILDDSAFKGATCPDGALPPRHRRRPVAGGTNRRLRRAACRFSV